MAIEKLDKLKGMTFAKQVTFAYLTCKRMFPNYVYFSENYGFGDTQIFREAIDYVYSAIFDEGAIDRQKVEHFLSILENNIPNTNDYSNYYGTVALDSSVIVYESINLLKKDDTDRIITAISTLSTDIIDCFIQIRDDMDYGDANFEENILNDSVMQTELTIQNGIISYLEKIAQLYPSDIETLMQLQNNESRTLLV